MTPTDAREAGRAWAERRFVINPDPVTRFTREDGEREAHQSGMWIGHWPTITRAARERWRELQTERPDESKP